MVAFSIYFSTFRAEQCLDLGRLLCALDGSESQEAPLGSANMPQTQCSMLLFARKGLLWCQLHHLMNEVAMRRSPLDVTGINVGGNEDIWKDISGWIAR